jgi:heme-degrading monooxygenase HmoA
MARAAMDHRRRFQRDDPRASRMIVRSWSARLDARNVARYLEHLDHSVKPALAALPGFLGAAVLERRLDGSSQAVSEVVVQTRWQSLDAIRAFAGDDISAAVVEPAAAALFSDYDRRVLHYQVIG